MELTTTNIAEMKLLFNSLKDILSETNMVFTPSGIKIITMDKLQTTLVDLFLPADNFDMYSCNHEKIVIAIDLIQFYKIIHSLETNDELTIKYDFGTSDYLKFMFKNTNRVKHLKMKLIEPDDTESVIPNVVYNHETKLNTTEFKKAIKTMIGNILCITTKTDKLNLLCSDSYIDTSVEFNNVDYVKTSDTEIKQKFELKSIMSITKCCGLCDTVSIHQAVNRPIIFGFETELGILKICISEV